MSKLWCPNCDHEHNMGDYPDHLTDMVNNRFEFECEKCEAEFDVHVDWDPDFYPLDDTIKLKEARHD